MTPARLASAVLTTAILGTGLTVGAARAAISPQPWKVVSAKGGVAPLYPAAIAFDPNGVRYVADSGRDRIVTVSNRGSIRVVSAAAAAGWRDPKDVSVDVLQPRSLWVADTGNDRIVRLNTVTGATTVLAGGLTDAQGVANDDTGVYVADTYADRVVKFRRDGSVAWSLGACGTAFGRPRDVAVGADGNVYLSDTDNDRIVRITSGGVCSGSITGVDAPRSIALTPAGLWVTEGLSARVRLFRYGGAHVRSFGGYGSRGTQFRSPFCVAFRERVLEVCDTYAWTIKRFRVGSSIETLGNLGGTPPASGGFAGPWDVTYAPNGTFVVSDWFNHRLQRFDGSGAFLSKVGAYGLPERRFIFPRGLGMDGGTLVVTDSENNRLQFLDPVSWSTVDPVVRPSGTPKFSRPHQTAAVGDGTYWVADTLNRRALHVSSTGTELHEIDLSGTPRGIAIDAFGRVYVSHGDRIDRFTSGGVFDATITTSGTAPGSVKQPYGLRIEQLDGAERLFVADRDNHRVQILDLNGGVVAVLDPAGTSFGAFFRPQGVDVDPGTGRIAIADFGNDRVVIWNT